MARTTLARRLGIAATILAVSGGLTACVGGDDSKASDSTGESASETPDTSDDSTEEGESGEEASGELAELSADEFYPAIIAALQEAETMRIAMTSTSSTGQGDSEMTGVMRYAEDGAEMQASSAGDQPMEMIMVDKMLYISGAGMPLPEGKTWLKVDLSDPNSLFGQLGKSTDPEFMFKAMQDPKEFKLIGEEEVDGEATNHYSITYDGKQYAKNLGMPEEMGRFMPDEITTDMWIDAENRPRKFSQDLEMPSPTGNGKPMQQSTVGTYSDFGTDVEIQAPPAAEVSDNIPGM